MERLDGTLGNATPENYIRFLPDTHLKCSGMFRESAIRSDQRRPTRQGCGTGRASKAFDGWRCLLLESGLVASLVQIGTSSRV